MPYGALALFLRLCHKPLLLGILPADGVDDVEQRVLHLLEVVGLLSAPLHFRLDLLLELLLDAKPLAAVLVRLTILPT